MKHYYQQVIEKLLGSLSFSLKDNLYGGPLYYHGVFYTLQGFEIIMGGMVMELKLKRIGCSRWTKFFEEKTIIDEDAGDIVFTPLNSLILFKEKKSK
jgi:hypothetical protein